MSRTVKAIENKRVAIFGSDGTPISVNVNLAVHLQTDDGENAKVQENRMIISGIHKNQPIISGMRQEKVQQKKAETRQLSFKLPETLEIPELPDSEFISPPNELLAPQERLQFEDPECSKMYYFAHIDIPSDQVFLRTPLSFAFANIKPVVEGHVLVCPIRSVAKVADLTASEAADLINTTRAIVGKFEEYFGVKGTKLLIQDGEDAGQTIKHVHMHIFPIRTGDSLGVYKKLHEGESQSGGKRTREDMAKEAIEYRKLFYPVGSAPCQLAKRNPELIDNTDRYIAAALEQQSLFRMSTKPPQPSPPIDDISAKSSMSPSSQSGHKCACIRCRRMKCPDCVDVKKEDSAGESKADAAMRTFLANIPKDEWKTLPVQSRSSKFDEQQIEQRRRQRQNRADFDRALSDFFGIPPSDETSTARTLFVGAFVAGAGIATISVVKSLC